jgi:hypothetical protein
LAQDRRESCGSQIEQHHEHMAERRKIYKGQNRRFFGGSIVVKWSGSGKPPAHLDMGLNQTTALGNPPNASLH